MKATPWVGLALVFMPSVLRAEELPRLPITGVAHVALYVHDLERSRAFYRDFLGYAEPFSLTNSDGTILLTFIKINDRQYLELFPEREAHQDRLSHIAVETPDADALRAELASRGLVVPSKVSTGRIGNSSFNISDPDGHQVEIVEYRAGSWSLREWGRFVPDTRISTRLMHVGILVTNLEAAMNFYQAKLGFRETWRGGRNTNQLNWVNLAVPSGSDYVEFMLESRLPEPDKRGVAHHLCLEVPDIEKARAMLLDRSARCGYTRPLQIQTGINRKRQLNLYDPDGTRVELMEPRPVDESSPDSPKRKGSSPG